MTADLPTKSPLGRPKGDKRARTRAKLLDAARTLIREKGYENTTLLEVAERAGMTSGAIYGNFKNRDELFMALAEIYWPPISPNFKPNSTLPEKMRAYAEATIAAIPDRRMAAVGRLSGMAYALGHEEMRVRVEKLTAQSFELGAVWLRAVTDDKELSMPPRTFVCILHAMTEGLVFQRLLTPELVPDEVFYAAFSALANDQQVKNVLP